MDHFYVIDVLVLILRILIRSEQRAAYAVRYIALIYQISEIRN